MMTPRTNFEKSAHGSIAPVSTSVAATTPSTPRQLPARDWRSRGPPPLGVDRRARLGSGILGSSWKRVEREFHPAERLGASGVA